MMKDRTDSSLEKLELWSDDILEFASEALGVDLRSHQRDFLEFCGKPSTRQATIRPAQGSGGSYALCVLALWEALQNPDQWVLVTCPTRQQWSGVLQPTLASLVSEAKDPLVQKLYEVRNTKVVIAGKYTGGILFRSCGRPEGFAGFHMPTTLLVDQVQGIRYSDMVDIEAVHKANPHGRGPFCVRGKA